MNTTRGQGSSNGSSSMQNEPSVPPKSTSRQPLPVSVLDAEDEEAIPPVPRFPEGKQVLEGCDERLRMAFATCVTQLGRELVQKRGIKEWKDLLSWENMTIVQGRIMQAVKNNATLKSGDENTIIKQITANMDEIAQQIFKSGKSSFGEREGGDISTPQGKRAKLSELWGRIQAGDDYYKILGISRTSSEADIKGAHKKLLMLHSDRAGYLDEDADTIMQELNNARDVLCNKEKRKKYDSQLNTMDVDDTGNASFGEEFDPSAFSREEDAANGKDQSEERSTTQVPNRSPEIVQVHDKMQPILAQIFGDRTVPSSDILRNIRLLDHQIEETNISQGVDDKAYQVGYGLIATLHKDMNRHLGSIERGLIPKDKAKIDADQFRNHISESFNKTQLPSEWANIILNLVDNAIDQMPDSEQTTSKTWKPFTEENVHQTGGGDGSQARRESNDESHSKGIRKGFGFGSTSSANKNNGSNNPPQVQIQQWPGPGFTRRGDNILGYKPVYNRIINRHGEEEDIFVRAKFLIRDEGDNKGNTLRIVSGQDIGKMAAKAYHLLTKDEKNDLTGTGERYKIKDESVFKQVTGVCWVGNFCTADRMPEVWVEIELYPEAKPDPVLANKPHLMTRSDLCRWLGQKTADYEIDQYIAGKGIVPPWAWPGEMNEEIDRNDYMPLNYPPTAILKRQRLKGMSHASFLSYGNSTDGYLGMQNYSQQLPNSRQQGLLQSPVVDNLAKQIEELQIAMRDVVKHLQIKAS